MDLLLWILVVFVGLLVVAAIVATILLMENKKPRQGRG
jgi:hypothetical protein